MSENTNWHDEVKHLLAKGQLENAILLFDQKINDNEIREELIIISGRFQISLRESRLGISQDSDNSFEKISRSLLELLGKFNNDHGNINNSMKPLLTELNTEFISAKGVDDLRQLLFKLNNLKTSHTRSYEIHEVRRKVERALMVEMANKQVNHKKRNYRKPIPEYSKNSQTKYNLGCLIGAIGIVIFLLFLILKVIN